MRKITTTLISLINSTIYMSFLKDVHLRITQRQICKLPPSHHRFSKLKRNLEIMQQPALPQVFFLFFFKQETETQRRKDLPARVRTWPDWQPPAYYFSLATCHFLQPNFPIFFLGVHTLKTKIPSTHTQSHSQLRSG